MRPGETRRHVAYRLTSSKMRDRLGDKVADHVIHDITLRLEQAIYQECLSNTKGFFPSWADERFSRKYVELWRHIHLNLIIDENNFRDRLYITQEFEPEQVPKMSNDEIYPLLDHEYKAEVASKDSLRVEKFNAKLVKKSEGLVKCFYCVRTHGAEYAYHVEFTEAQTRSADEPMTKFCHCLNCGTRWKM